MRDGLSDVNTYYTASWGSPYQRASRDVILDSSARLVAAQLRDRPLDGESPTASPPFGLDYLVPSRVPAHPRDITPSFGLEHLIPSRIPIQAHISNPVSSDRLASQSDQALQPPDRTPVRHQVTRSLTEDWVHQYSSGHWKSERGNWLSDESAESDSSSEKSEDFKTPIPFTWFSGRHRRRNSTSVDSPALSRIGLRRPSSKHGNNPIDTFKKHKTRQSNLTLKQEDFWKIVRTADPRPEDNMSLFESRWASDPLKDVHKEEDKENVDHTLDTQQSWKPAPPQQSGSSSPADRPLMPLQKSDQPGSNSRAEKPLPPTPAEEAETDVEEEKEVDIPPQPIAKDVVFPTAPLPTRPRTKLLWKGKACWIGLPSSGPESYGRPKPLSASEIQSRLQAFEEAGYDISGFDVDSHVPSGAVSQGRAIFPDPSEEAMQRQKGDYQVRVPNPKLWKEYMDQQIEAKLAALGVSLGDDPAPAPPAMSRQPSGQFPGRSFSPNAMAASMHGGSHRSTPSLAHFSTAGHSHSASVASPLSMPGAPGHMHRHSVFTGMPFGFPQQQNAHSGLPAFSPNQHFNMNGVARGGSPALERLRSDSVGPSKSPLSPFGGVPPYGMSKSPQSMHPELAMVPPHMRHQSVYSSFSPTLPQPSVTPSIRAQPALPELREDEEEQSQDYFSGALPESQQPEMIHPSPRGRNHRHNISEGLERDIQEAEYHLERSIEREMNESEAHERFHESTRSQPKQAQQAYVPPGKRSSMTSNGLAEQTPPMRSTSTSDSVANAGFGAPLQNKLLTKTRGHASKLSVAAPEFKFNPGGFQPTLLGFPGPAYGNVRNLSSENTDGTAQAFQPTGFGGFGGATLPTTNFNFSSSVAHVPSAASVQPQQQSQHPSIFGNVNIADVVKPARRSKAIVIKAPASPAEPLKEEKEDENGRTLQSDERQKRARTQRADGDDVPLFAEQPKPSERKESPIMPVPEELKLGTDDSSHDDRTAVPVAVAPKKETSLAAQTLPEEDSEILAEGQSLIEHERKTSSQRGHKKNTSSLSALAKPFEFKPGGSSSFTPQEPVRTLSPGALEGKPDLSPSRVFSRNITANHQNVESLSYNTSPEPHKHAPHPQGEPENVQYPEPSFNSAAMPTFDEIDAVMQQLNDESEGESPTFPAEFIREGTPGLESSVIRLSPTKHMRSDAPSPTPGRGHFTRHINPSLSPLEDSFPPEQFEMPSGPSINRLNRENDVPMSEWSEDLELDEERIQTRSRFFDDRIDSIVGNILQDRLQPLEKSLQLIHRAVSSKFPQERSRPATGRTTSAVDSDADDEDDLPTEKQVFRPLSSGNDKRAQQVKAAVLEALAIQEANAAHKSPGLTSAFEIHQALMDMNTTIARIAGANLDIDDVRAVVEDALHRHNNALVPANLAPAPPSPELERSHKRAITELEGRFNETLAGKLEEANQRRMTEEREADTRRLLRLAEEELSLLRETTSDQDQRIHSLQREFQASLGRAEEAERAKRETEAANIELQKQLSDVEAENSAFESTLEEYRLSSNKWRQEVDDLSSENESLKGTVNELKAQIADGLNIRENMRGKFDKIHADMASAAEQLANEKSTWQSRNEELQKKTVILQARLEGEISVRRSFEEEVQSLRAQVHDGVASKIHLEQALRSNAAQEDALNTLKTDLAAEQTLVTRLERDLHEARESGRAEVQRTQMIMESSIEAANSQAAIIRSSLEHELHLAKNAIDDLRMHADTAKARHELLLEEEADLRRDALRKVNETSSASLNDLREKHEQALRFMKVQHEKELTHALEDKHRGESYLQDRLSLSSDQVAHLQDRVAHLEERLQVAQSAAKAAAKQAQAARFTTPAQSSSAPALVPARSLDEPEKISPQALRESILVLQEQLQERETRIESLQTEISSLDTTAPAKLKERDTEITWLRELLAVRNEDLSELIRQLEQEGFDREAVRDYAIRIRAGIQMEQAEKERLISAGTSKAALAVAGIVNVASPGAARLASAWGNWRKGRTESTSSSSPAPPKPQPTGTLASRALGKAPSSAAALRAAQQAQQTSRSRPSSRHTDTASATPSKPAPAPSPSVFAGLMTPPASSLRRTPSPVSAPDSANIAKLTGQPEEASNYERGTINHHFTHAAPPGFGPPAPAPRRTSPLVHETDAEQEGSTPGLFGSAYDSDAELGDARLLPDGAFSVGDDDDLDDDESDRNERVRVSGHGQDAGMHDDEEGEMMAEETLGKSLAAELENL